MSKQSKDKKRVSLGMGAPSTCLVTSRFVWSTVKDNKCMKNEVLANKSTALSWFCSFKTFSHRRDGRTYAQVLSQSTKLPVALPSKHNLGTHIVAIRMQMHAVLPLPRLVCQALATSSLASQIINRIRHITFLPLVQNTIVCLHCRTSLKLCKTLLIIL